jgi:hypothetical protein
VSNLSTPSPNLIITPVAKRIEDVPSCSAKKIPHLLISRPRARSLVVGACLDIGTVACVAGCVTVVVLPVVNTPAGKKICVLLLVALTSWITCASLGSAVTIKPELEAHCVDLIGDWLDTSWPLCRVRNKIALGVTLLCRPAVINVDVLVSSILETKVDKSLGCSKGNFLAGCVTLSLILAVVLVTNTCYDRLGRSPPSRSSQEQEAFQLHEFEDDFVKGQPWLIRPEPRHREIEH